MTEQRFTGSTECRHCKNTAPMKISASLSQVKSYEDETPPGTMAVHWNEGDVYDLLTCPACRGVTLRRYYWHDGWMGPDDPEIDVLYPASDTVPSGLPGPIAKAYRVALRVRAVDANLFGVQLGRVLELVCADRGTTKKFLAQRIAELADNNEIPQNLVAVAEGLTKLRNVGAHPSLGDLTTNEVPVMEQLCRAILEYVYSAPTLAERATKSLDRLKGSSA